MGAPTSVDEDLIRASQTGDRHAFSQLLELIYDSILLFALKWTQCMADAEDITQQVCMKLAKVIGQFRFQSSFTTWLYRIVVNTAQDWRRKQSPPGANEPESIQPEMVTTSEATAETDAELDRVLDEISQLGKGFRETILLVYGEGFSHKEAAEILGVKESTVSWRLHEIRRFFQASENSGKTTSMNSVEVSQ